MSDDRVAGYIDPEHPQRKYYKCEYCGESFWKPDAFRKKYCGEECQRKAYSEAHPRKIRVPKPLEKKVCQWCGQEFQTNMPSKIYCSKACGYQGNLKQKRDEWAANYRSRKLKCKECGSDFMTECGNKHSVFCCQSCAEKHERRIEHKSMRHRQYMRRMKIERRKLIRQGFKSPVHYEDVYRNSNGICGICGMPVYKERGGHSNWDGTVDHIVPLSVGGEHSLANCQLAHRICNSLKCTEGKNYKLNWNEKSKENNYWRIKFEEYQQLS